MRLRRGTATLVRPRVPQVTLNQQRSELVADFDLSSLPGGHFIVDIYSVVRIHPDRHLGWWDFQLGGRQGRARVSLDFSSREAASVRLEVDGQAVEPREHWINPDYVFEPIQDIQLVVRDGGLQMLAVGHVFLRATDLATLNRYAQFVYKTQAYVPPAHPMTWVLTFHAARLQYVSQMLSRHVPPGSRLLDVASGHSLFTEPSLLELQRDRWQYKITCCDLAVDVLEERVHSFPQYNWLRSDVMNLPFVDGQFDAVLAGEIVEHVDGTQRALSEWIRVLRPGGTLILTTPNRHRLTNRLRGYDQPMAPDHINELTYRECLAELRRAGLRVVESRPVYIELFANWFWHGRDKFDYLQHHYNWPRLRPLMRFLMNAGRFFPSYAFDLMFACRKPA